MSDDPRNVAFNPQAPQAEQFDAHAELTRIYRPTTSDLIPAASIHEFAKGILDMHADQEMMLKAKVIDMAGYRDTRGKRKEGMQSVYLDDMQIFAQGDYFEKPAPVGFEMLRQMVDQTPILSAIVLTIQRDMQRFCLPQERDDGQPGFTIAHVDPKHKASEGELAKMRDVARFFRNCGSEFNPRARKRLKRDNFTQLMMKLIRDGLTMDAAAIETEWARDRGHGLAGLYAVDGATIRLCDEHGYDGDDSIFAVQIIQGRIVTAYDYDSLIYEPRNPRTDVRLAGYGMSETELLVRVVTGYLNAMTYNLKGFDSNAIPRGMLQLFGDYDSENLDAFKRAWNAMVKGINNAWSLPVLVAKDTETKAEFTNFGIEFNEMYFAKWMTFLTSTACAIYGVSPDKIYTDGFSGGNTSPLSGSDTAEKIEHSADNGMRPRLAHFESIFSDFVVAEANQDWCFRFTGLDPEDPEKVHEKKKLVLSVDEVRAEMNYQKAPGEWGAAPINPSLVGVWQQSQQAGQEDFGSLPDEDGEGGGNADRAAGVPGEIGRGGGDDRGGAGDPGRNLQHAAVGKPQGDFGKAFPIYGIDG